MSAFVPGLERPRNSLPHRYETDDDLAHSRIVHVVWEITLACNLKCLHCGSRAGRKRPRELSTAECLEVVRQCAALGAREITLIGGEAHLRRDWLQIIRAINDYGIHSSLQSGALTLTEERIRQAKHAGLKSAGVSIDGLPDLHDRLRGVPGSYERCIEALGHLHKHGVPRSANTQIGAETPPHLRSLLHVIASHSVRNWQLQLTVPMGNAADNPALVLQPYRLIDLMPLLAEIYDEALDLGVLIQPGNNIGYFGPYEHKWRVAEYPKHWAGCMAGRTVLGIEADGTIKGCPSLATSPYSGGNIRDMSIEAIRKTPSLRFASDRTADELWGFCASCYYADVCHGGCTWTSHSLFDRPGNNPYCHHRALELAKRGLRERVEKVSDAPGRPFDNGRFELIVEPVDGGASTDRVATPIPTQTTRQIRTGDQTPAVLALCRSCNHYVVDPIEPCPFCGANVAKDETEHDRALVDVRAAIQDLERLIP